MSFIDLHTHSTASDGSDTPAELVQKAARIGLHAIALTDHDTLSGLDDAADAAHDLGIEFIRGCEVSARSDQGSIHILGLWVPANCDSLENFLAHLRNARDRRNGMILKKLQSHGLKITIDEVASHACGTIGRPHIAEVLLEKGYVDNRKEAFDEWLDYNGKAYVPKPAPAPHEAVRILAEAGAAPIVAHPMLRPAPEDWLKAFTASLLPYGLFGLEAWHSSHTVEQSQVILNIAKMFSLGVSGGSDYHGLNKPDISLGKGHGNLHLKREVLENMKKIRKSSGLPC